MQLSNMLAAWQWAVLAAIPPAIIALYFLKLRRLPLEVPSTYLWRKSLEDLHVNSLWQRLRRSILLLLQLLLIGLLMLALLRPTWEGATRAGGRSIYLIDNSASMSATDVRDSRLGEARRRVGQMLDQMSAGDQAMIISFAEGARVEQAYTENLGELRRRLAEVDVTQQATSIAEALRVASGLANPGRSGGTEAWDTKVAEAQPARLFILSDGRFGAVPEFSLGNLDAEYIPLGDAQAKNVGIVAFNTRRHDEKAGQLQAFARIENFSAEVANVVAELYLNGERVDAQQVDLPARGAEGVVFDLGEVSSAALELRLDANDALAVDDRAFAALNEPRRARVLLVTAGNPPLEFALRTERALRLAEITKQTPATVATPEFAKTLASETYDLVIFDRCQPVAHPLSNTLYVGSLPPGQTWKALAAVEGPQIIDVERAHPLMQLLDLGDVLLASATPLEPPEGGSTLLDSNAGPLLAIAPREGYEDAVLGVEIFNPERVSTNWPLRVSFPTFVLNLLEYLGGSRDALAQGGARPGRPATFRLETAAKSLDVSLPDGQKTTVQRGPRNEFVLTETSQTGIYEVREGAELRGRIAVNLFDAAESNIAPVAQVKLGDIEVAGRSDWTPGRRDAWKWLALAALAVLLIEWYIYNRRVYL